MSKFLFSIGGGILATSILYTITGCSKCFAVKSYLLELGIIFEEVNLLENRIRAKEVEQLVGEVVTPLLSHRDEVYKFYGDWKNKLLIKA